MKSNAEYVVLSFLIPDHEMKNEFVNDEFPSIQTQNFNWSFIKALESSSRYRFGYVSTRAISDYPLNSKKYVKKKKWKQKISSLKEIEIQEISFVNIGVIKLVTRFLNSLYYCWKLFFKNSSRKGIIVYSVHVPYLLTGFLVAKIFKLELISIWTDPPSVTYIHDSLLKKMLRKIEYKISTYLMNKSDKLIVLTKYLAEDFAPGKPYIVIEGILDKEKIMDNYVENKNDNNKKRIVYTGTLEEKYGIENIIQAFGMLKNKDILLEVYGKGNFLDKLINLEEKNVVYKGYAQHEEIIEIQKKADFLINARSNDDDYVKYSFPSKTIEYLASGTPVISTILSGFPDEYKNHLINIKDNSPIEIKNAIERAVNLNSTLRNQMSKNAKIFINTKTVHIQGKKINDFLSLKICDK